jgi:Mg2+ and Co2+ transporter CorA
VVTLAVVVVVARRQRRLELLQRGTDDGNAVTTERIIKLVDSVATVIRALEERTRELETSVKAFGAARSAHDQELAERLASALADLGTYQQTLADDFLPSIARRDERLVAIDANLTAVTDRLAKLGADTAQNAGDTAVLGECFRSLERSVSELTNGLVELRRSLPEPPERPPQAATGFEGSQASDHPVGPDRNPTSDGDHDSAAGSADAAPSDEIVGSDAPGAQSARDG